MNSTPHGNNLSHAGDYILIEGATPTSRISPSHTVQRGYWINEDAVLRAMSVRCIA